MEKLSRQPVIERRMTPDKKPVNGLKAARQNNRSSPDDDQRLAKACADFEAIFVQHLFKTMRASVPESTLTGGGRAEELYTSMLDQQVATQMAHGQGSIGLAKQMQSKLAHFLATGTIMNSK